MIELITKAPLYRSFRATGFPQILPVSLALTVTNRCNSRCATCRIYKKKSDELDCHEYKKIFKSLSHSPRWITVTGGEPFMRADLDGILGLIVHHVKPDAITIATNGFFTERIFETVRNFLVDNSDVKLMVNISFDAIGPTHDRIRGLEGSFESARETFFAIKSLKDDFDNLNLGVSTVISKFNIDSIPSLMSYTANFMPDSHIFEPAQRRAELNAQGLDIMPDPEELDSTLKYISQNQPVSSSSVPARIIRNFRNEYYRLASDILRRREQVIPCFAGTVSAHISAGGNVWSCCTLARSMGNLRDADYKFDRVWGSREASRLRRYIRQNRCYCVMANASYSNLVMHTPSFFRIASRYAVGM